MKPAAKAATPTALYLGEVIGELNQGASFLDRLSPAQVENVRRLGRVVSATRGETVFLQGSPHEGIFLIEHGIVRSYYTSPSGREITLAYWTPGHFVGGPEVFGSGLHIWSGEAAEDCRLLYLSGATIRELVERMPAFAICLIEGLVAKSKCYSALVQMLGTRSAIERLAQLLVILGEIYGRHEANRLVVQRKVTHDQLATIVGVTRQWVTTTLDRFQKKGIISVGRQAIVIERPDLLLEMVRGR
ncbi:MAG TPA: Crp/Fnr family transcriptional regulator [Candidatus Sulfotelmatobacter sp.]|nr:Crp/Fnr family transcriptional regulator [Candidatus Sulfotelmatobacter sp.]